MSKRASMNDNKNNHKYQPRVFSKLTNPEDKIKWGEPLAEELVNANEQYASENTRLKDYIEKLERRIYTGIGDGDIRRVLNERDRYRDALKQIASFPHAPDAYIVAQNALSERNPK